MDFSDISGITIIQVLSISFKTSSRIKCEFEPPPPIITLSGCKRLDVILFCFKIFNASSSIINDALTPCLLAFSSIIFLLPTLLSMETNFSLGAILNASKPILPTPLPMSQITPCFGRLSSARS